MPSATLRQGIIMAQGERRQRHIELGRRRNQAIDPLGSESTRRMLDDLQRSCPLANDPSAGVDGGLNSSGYRFNAPMTLDNKAYVVKTDVKLDSQSAHNLSVRATVADHAQDELLAQYPGWSRQRGC